MIVLNYYAVQHALSLKCLRCCRAIYVRNLPFNIKEDEVSSWL